MHEVRLKNEHSGLLLVFLFIMLSFKVDSYAYKEHMVTFLIILFIMLHHTHTHTHTFGHC